MCCCCGCSCSGCSCSLSIGGSATFALPKLGLHALDAAVLWACLWAVLLDVYVILGSQQAVMSQHVDVYGRIQGVYESTPSSCMKFKSSSSSSSKLSPRLHLSFIRDLSGPSPVWTIHKD